MTSNSVKPKNFVLLHVLYAIRHFTVRVLSTIYCRLFKAYHTCFLTQFLHTVYYSVLSYIFGSRKRLEWKTHWQSPVCRAILRRKYYMTHSKSALSWALYNFTLAILLIFDMKTSFISAYFSGYSDFVWYSEFLVFFIVSFTACTAFLLYTWSIFSKPMPISPVQQKLFGIGDKDPGFELKKHSGANQETEVKRLLFNSYHDSDCSFLSVTPLNYSAKSWASSPSYCLDATSSSWTYYHPSPPDGFSSTPKFQRSGNNALGRKLILSDSADSPFERPIKNSKQLDEFLKLCEEEEKKIKSMSFEESMSNVSTLDNSPLSVLSKCRYQRACRLPSMETVENDSSEMHYGDGLHKLKITEKMLTVWCERLRKWLCQTILVRLVAEIDDINNSLSQIGLPEYHIGSVNLFALHQIAVTKFQHLTTLSSILPYLDMHLNQEYLVQRFRSLARGGCMGEFKWNSGGSSGDKQWCDDLPTDSAIIIHVLCCYLDAYLPPEPHFPEGKPFSSKYFKKTPEKIVHEKDTHYIYQSSINPPHFKVVIGQDIYSLQKGRNNLFYALLIFLHYLKTKECSMLGRVNLGPSGLNILWVID